jgi:hypothetical protein
LAPNHKIYGIPYDSDKVLVFDTKNYNYYNIHCNLNRNGGQMVGGVLAPNNKIYCIPYSIKYPVMIIDTDKDLVYENGIYEFTYKYQNTHQYDTWQGGVYHPNGKIYGIPSHSKSIFIIDPYNNNVDLDTLKSDKLLKGYVGGVLGIDNNIYCIPSDSNDTNEICVINPTLKSIDFIQINKDIEPNYQIDYYGGVLAPDGCIYSFPKSGNRILIIDIDNKYASISEYTIDNTIEGYYGCILHPNGRIYGIPDGSNKIISISHGLPKYLSWMYEPYFNKF